MRWTATSGSRSSSGTRYAGLAAHVSSPEENLGNGNHRPLSPPGGSLLAVDTGLRLGLALYGADGRLVWCRASHLVTRARLRRAVRHLLGGLPAVGYLVLEGGGPLARIWQQEAERRGLAVMTVSAERWRERLLCGRERRDGQQAKASAADFARRVLCWSGVSPPPSLRADAAEAVLAGLWAVLELGWLERVPPALGCRVPPPPPANRGPRRPGARGTAGTPLRQPHPVTEEPGER